MTRTNRRSVAEIILSIAATLAVLAPAASAQSVATPNPDPNHEILSPAFQAATDARSMSRLTSGNALELLVDGVVSFPRKHALVQNAQKSVFVTTMQWDHDGAGVAFADELIAAAARGVTVRCVVDGAVPDPRIVRKLRQGGVGVARYNPWGFGIGGRSGRLHEKIVCVDLARATVGGMNIADDYALGNGTNRYYHDCDILVEGYAAVEVGRRFLQLYASLDPTDSAVQALLAGLPALAQVPSPAPGRDGFARVLYNEPDLGNHFITDYYLRCFRAAKRQIVWHVNNLQPVEPILSELKGAGLRGVRVVVLTNSKKAYQARNGKIFGFFQDWYNNFYQRKLASPGIELWELDSPIHSKAMTIDGVMASVGSYNFGKSSISDNTEQTLVTYDPATIAAVEATFDLDIARAIRVR